MHRLASLAARSGARTLLSVAFLCLLPFVLFAPVTVGGYTLLPADNLRLYQPFGDGAAVPQNELLNDLILQNYPWKAFIRASLGNGELPLWNPYLFGGVPFLAAGQHSALYPFSVIYYALPLASAFGWFTVSQLALAGLCMYALARTYGLRRDSAVFAGVTYQLSGFLVVGVVHQMIIASAAWLPLLIALAERIIRQDAALGGRRASAPWAVAGALAFACHILAGHVEITIYAALVMTLYSIWRIVFSSQLRDLRFVASRVGWLLVMGLGGAAIASVQLLPLLELVTRNFRGAGRSTLEQVRSYAFPSRYVLMWLLPNFYGNPSQHAYFDLFQFAARPLTSLQGSWWGYAAKEYVESSVYVGLAPLILSALGAASAFRRDNTRLGMPALFFVVLAVLSLLFIFGTPAYALLYYGLPGINQLHSPFRWKIPLTLALAVLAALGFERSVAGSGRLQRFMRALCAGGMASGALAVLAVAGVQLLWPSFSARFATAWSASELAGLRFPSAEAWFSFMGGNVIAFGLLLVGSCLLIGWRLANSRISPNVRSAALIGFLALDLVVAWRGFNPAVDPALLDETPAAIQFLQQDGEAVDGLKLWRVTSLEPPGRFAKTANANMLWPYGIQDVRGYDSIIPRQYVDYQKLIQAQGDLLYNRIAPITTHVALDSPLIDLLGVKYVLTEYTIESPGYALAFEQPGMRIYRNTRVMPRAYSMPDASTLAPPPGSSHQNWFGDAIQQFDPRRFVIVDSGDDPRGCAAKATCRAANAAEPRPAVITVYRNSEVWIDAQVSSGEWLILNDSHFPGWRAWVRPHGGDDASEREVPVHRVNGNFRGVRLDAAALPAATAVATVRFRYSPDSVRFGAFASALSLIALLLIAGMYAWRSVADSADSLSGARRVARNSLVLAGMNIVARLIAFVFAIVVARMLGPDGVGAYYFAVVVIGWFDIVLNFGLNTYLAREVARDRAHAAGYFRHTTALRMILAAGTAPVLLLVVLLGQRTGYFSDEVARAIVILGASQVLSSINAGLSALFFAFERGEVPAALSVIGALSNAAIGAVLLVAGLGVTGLALTSAAVNVITLGLFVVLTRQMLSVRLAGKMRDFQVRTSRIDMLRESAPLMINHLLASIEFKLDVPILKASKPPASVFGGAVNSESVVGWYSTGYRYIDAFNIIPSFFTTSLFPALARLATQRDDALLRTFTLAIKLLVILAFPLAVATTFVSPTLAGFFGASFLPHGAVAISIMAWSMIAGWINSVTNYALIAVNQQRTITRAFAITLGFNLLANVIFIPLFSYQAAAVITIGSEIVKGAVFYHYVRRHIAPLNWVGILARPALAAGVMALFAGAAAYSNMLLPGLAAGMLAYAGMLIGTRALNADERAMLAPLLRRRNSQL